MCEASLDEAADMTVEGAYYDDLVALTSRMAKYQL
jgi:hypothetical protein